jgi:hypothetical protein
VRIFSPLLPAAFLCLCGCATNQTTVPPSAQVVSANARQNGQQISLRPFSCTEFKLVLPHLGKITAAGVPDISKPDVVDVLTDPDWLAKLHHLLGDTDDTIKSSRENNAAWNALCALPK